MGVQHHPDLDAALDLRDDPPPDLGVGIEQALPETDAELRQLEPGRGDPAAHLAALLRSYSRQALAVAVKGHRSHVEGADRLEMRGFDLAEVPRHHAADTQSHRFISPGSSKKIGAAGRAGK